jgi:hypothetical protein
MAQDWKSAAGTDRGGHGVLRVTAVGGGVLIEMFERFTDRARRVGCDSLSWPHRDGLKWLHMDDESMAL